GQFGVGFYSAFMVAEKVEVFTRSWEKDASCYHWASDGSGQYTLEETEGERRGCKIIVHLKDEFKEFAQKSRIENIIQRYSNFVSFPIHLNGDHVNTLEALWLKSKSELKDEDLKAFYQFQAHAFDEPFTWMHFTTDAPLDIH
ncbi:MAG TPA: molecular chaperone HtpG, partial [Opitutae bacterium]|nr:molecular chaperone HtpG [Opitutae bacterium]